MLPIFTGQYPDNYDRDRALFFWYHRGNLEAMLSGSWKLHFPHKYRSLEGREPGNNGIPAKYNYQMQQPLALYDLSNDPAESTDVSAEQPEVLKELLKLAEKARGELGDRLTKRDGTENRLPGKVE